MERALWVAMAGAAGALLRYLVGLGLGSFTRGVPLATLLVNVVGCFLFCALGELALLGKIPETARVALSAGLLGGLTTYSSFNGELLVLGDRHGAIASSAYLVVTVAGCLLAGVAGQSLARFALRGGA